MAGVQSVSVKQLWWVGGGTCLQCKTRKFQIKTNSIATATFKNPVSVL